MTGRAAFRILLVGGSVLLWGEWIHWRASRQFLGSLGDERAPGEVVVVLGYKNSGDRINFINKWRVRAGLRSRNPECGPSRLLFSGGAPGGERSEAELMARYARGLVTDDVEIEVESLSRTTWENIEMSAPMIEDAPRIKIVSNSLHAATARIYLWRQRPDLAIRLVRASDYRFGELVWLKPVIALHSLRSRRSGLLTNVAV